MLLTLFFFFFLFLSSVESYFQPVCSFSTANLKYRGEKEKMKRKKKKVAFKMNLLCSLILKKTHFFSFFKKKKELTSFFDKNTVWQRPTILSQKVQDLVSYTQLNTR